MSSSPLIIDASVALKWVIQEEGADRARQLVADDVLAAPDLLFVECANVLWAKARRRQIDVHAARAALEAIEATPIRAIPSRALTTEAQVIAFALDQTAYDSLYLAAALREGCVLVTADAVFARAAGAHPLYQASVRLL